VGRFIRKVAPPACLEVVRDDREKTPFELPSARFKVRIHRLLTGDYSFKGLEGVVAIERKSGLAEICSDLAVSSRPRFQRFLDRMKDYPVRVMLVGGNGPNDAFTIPDYRGRVSTPIHRTAIWWLSNITVVYGIPVLFVGDPVVDSLVYRAFEDAYTAGMAYIRRGSK
jgi:ERCC4-type nuclease